MANKVIRSEASSVTAEDDARLIRKVFSDGLFNSSLTFSVVSGGTVRVPAMYGILQGRDFYLDAQTIIVPLGDNQAGSIYIHIDLSQSPNDRVKVIGYLNSDHSKAMYEDLNNGGTIAEMKIGTYQSSRIGVTETSTSGYPKVVNNTNSTRAEPLTLYANQWSNGQYTISDERITPNTMQQFMPGLGINKSQYKALAKAMIVDGGQRSGSCTLIALGQVPTIDIPVRVRFYDENSTVIN